MFSNYDDPPHPAEKPRGSRSLVVWTALALFAGLLLVYSLFFSAGLRWGAGESHPAVGQRLPALRLDALTGGGQGVQLDDLQGKVVLVNYWGTWCPPCKMELPSLVALAREMRDEPDFLFLSVSCGGNAANEDRDVLAESTAAFLQSTKTELPTYFDAGGESRKSLIVAANLHEFGYPATVLLDREGIIRALWIGYDVAYEREMELAVRNALARKPK